MSDWFEHFGYAKVGGDLVMGAYPQDRDDIAALAGAGITRILNLVQDVEYDPGAREVCVAALADAGIEEWRAELIDFGGLEAQRLESAAQMIMGWLDSGERVYVHCRAGWQRSATVVAAVISLVEGVTPREALELLRERKPTAQPLDHQRADLLEWWERRAV
ncbi:MAG: protein-tyrosine phosphatase family protein [Solirubrobacteraceae bacterium]